MSLSDDIDSAVESAATGGGNPADASPASATAPSAAASSAVASTATSGSDAAASPRSAPSAATITPPAPEPSTSTTAGEPPTGEWSRILENQRQKAANDARTAVFQALGLPENADLPTFRAHLSMLSKDARAYYQALGQSLQSRGLLQPPAAPASVPQPNLRAEDGTPAYGAEAVNELLKQQRENILAEIQSKMQPFEQMQQEQKARAIWNDALTAAKAELDEARAQWPEFVPLEGQIKAMMAADKRVTYQSAYGRLMKDRWSTRDATMRQQLLDEIKKAPAATANPAAHAPTIRSGKGQRSTNAMIDQAVEHAFGR